MELTDEEKWELWQKDYTIQKLISEYNLKPIPVDDKKEEFLRNLISCIRVINKGKSRYVIIKSDNNPMIEVASITDFKKNYNKDDFYLSNEKTEKKGKKTTIVEESFWLFADLKTDICQNTDFRWVPFPPGGEDPFKNSTILNIFKGFLSKPVKKKHFNQEKIQVILDHIRIVLANNDETSYNYIINLFAHIVQFPTYRRTCPIFVGKQGAGKTVLFEEFFFKYCIGDTYSRTVGTIDALLDDFNKQNYQKLAMCIQEVVATDAIRNKMSKFKNFITDRMMPVRGMYQETFDTDNYLSLFLCSNCLVPFQLEEGDRRHPIFEVNPQFCKNRLYHKTLRTACNEVAASHFMRFLLDQDIEEFDVSDIPATEIRLLNLSARGENVTPFLEAMAAGQIPRNSSVQPVFEEPERKETKTQGPENLFFLVQKEILYRKSFMPFELNFGYKTSFNQFCRLIVTIEIDGCRITEDRTTGERKLRIPAFMWKAGKTSAAVTIFEKKTKDSGIDSDEESEQTTPDEYLSRDGKKQPNWDMNKEDDDVGSSVSMGSVTSTRAQQAQQLRAAGKDWKEIEEIIRQETLAEIAELKALEAPAQASSSSKKIKK